VRTEHETSDTDAVLNGEINSFLKAFLMKEGSGSSDDDDNLL
jgi:hypothetical protein